MPIQLQYVGDCSFPDMSPSPNYAAIVRYVPCRVQTSLTLRLVQQFPTASINWLNLYVFITVRLLLQPRHPAAATSSSPIPRSPRSRRSTAFSGPASGFFGSIIPNDPFDPISVTSLPRSARLNILGGSTTRPWLSHSSSSAKASFRCVYFCSGSLGSRFGAICKLSSCL